MPSLPLFPRPSRTETRKNEGGGGDDRDIVRYASERESILSMSLFDVLLSERVEDTRNKKFLHISHVAGWLLLSIIHRLLVSRHVLRLGPSEKVKPLNTGALADRVDLRGRSNVIQCHPSHGLVTASAEEHSGTTGETTNIVFPSRCHPPCELAL